MSSSDRLKPITDSTRATQAEERDNGESQSLVEQARSNVDTNQVSKRIDERMVKKAALEPLKSQIKDIKDSDDLYYFTQNICKSMNKNYIANIKDKPPVQEKIATIKSIGKGLWIATSGVLGLIALGGLAAAFVFTGGVLPLVIAGAVALALAVGSSIAAYKAVSLPWRASSAQVKADVRHDAAILEGIASFMIDRLFMEREVDDALLAMKPEQLQNLATQILKLVSSNKIKNQIDEFLTKSNAQLRIMLDPGNTDDPEQGVNDFAKFMFTAPEKIFEGLVKIIHDNIGDKDFKKQINNVLPELLYIIDKEWFMRGEELITYMINMSFDKEQAKEKPEQDKQFKNTLALLQTEGIQAAQNGWHKYKEKILDNGLLLLVI